jgi:hypothetical protein
MISSRLVLLREPFRKPVFIFYYFIIFKKIWMGKFPQVCIKVRTKLEENIWAFWQGRSTLLIF